MDKIITKNEKETSRLGFSIGQKCVGGEVFALFGDLGAGKTKFLQGLASGLGIKDKVNSPTFNILKIYETPSATKMFCHIDAYRLVSGQDLISLGVEEFFDMANTVTAIEWADRVKEILPERTRTIRIKALSEQEREIIIA